MPASRDTYFHSFFTFALGGSSEPHAPDRFTDEEDRPVPIEYVAECYPQLVWTFWGTENSFARSGNRIPDRPGLPGKESLLEDVSIVKQLRKYRFNLTGSRTA
jgi:hypothetical protein